MSRNKVLMALRKRLSRRRALERALLARVRDRGTDINTRPSRLREVVRDLRHDAQHPEA